MISTRVLSNLCFIHKNAHKNVLATIKLSKADRQTSWRPPGFSQRGDILLAMTKPTHANIQNPESRHHFENARGNVTQMHAVTNPPENARVMLMSLL